MNRQRLETVGLGLIALFTLPIALQATLAPKSFFDDFPLGRSWLAHQGDAFNEHLVRDVGGLFLALIIVTAWTAWRHAPSRSVAVAWIVQGFLHLGFHAGHLDGFGTPDRIALIGSLLGVPVLGLVVLWAGHTQPAPAPSSR